jgi:putative ABC transport system ATP-binding protein
MIRLRDVTKVYEADGQRVEALRGVSLEVARGEFVALAGPSGCGKSTLLNLVGGIDVPTAGEVVVDGQALSRLSDRALSLYRREKVGFVHQLFNLLPTLTAAENVALPLLLKGIGAGEARARARRQLEAVGMGQREGHWPHQLSGGEQQRVAIARAIVHEPPIILADEPTGNLDSKAGTEVLDLLSWLVLAQGRTLLLATHSREAAGRAQRVVALRDGAVVPAGGGEDA